MSRTGSSPGRCRRSTTRCSSPMCRRTSRAGASGGSRRPGISTARSGSSIRTCAVRCSTSGVKPAPRMRARSRRGRRSPRTTRSGPGSSAPAARAGSAVRTGTKRSRSSPRRASPRRGSGAPTGSSASPRSPRCRMLSYAAGSRFLQLLGGVNLSFYDWYADLPNAFPEVWGDQTDVCESADWYKSKYIVAMGSNLSMTRTPDVHFIAEARYEGTKLVCALAGLQPGREVRRLVAPDARRAGRRLLDGGRPRDPEGVPRRPAGAVFRRLSEALHGLAVPGGARPRRGDATGPAASCARASLSRYAGGENGDWKFLVWDEKSGQPRMPQGTGRLPLGQEQGKWNLVMKDGARRHRDRPGAQLPRRPGRGRRRSSSTISHRRARHRAVCRFASSRRREGRVPVATVYDLLMAQFGVGRGLPGDYPAGYDEPTPYTPAWQEKFTGIGRETVIRFAREFADNAERTSGKSLGHHRRAGSTTGTTATSPTGRRSPALVLCGCCGVNGGGMNHYVGQEKLAPLAPWAALAFALDWAAPAAPAEAPSWHYMHSDQWRYDAEFGDYDAAPAGAKWANGHTADLVAKAVRMGWLPFIPAVRPQPARGRGRSSRGGRPSTQVAGRVADAVSSRAEARASRSRTRTPPENWPRVWFIWRGNALMSSAKGHEYFLRHYLGTHDNAIAEEAGEGQGQGRRLAGAGAARARWTWSSTSTSGWTPRRSTPTSSCRPPAGTRRTTSTPPTCTPSSTRCRRRCRPCWEAKSRLGHLQDARGEGQRARTAGASRGRCATSSRARSRTTAPTRSPSASVRDWREGECEPIPGKTMPRLCGGRARLRANSTTSSCPSGRVSGRRGSVRRCPHPDGRFYDELLESPVGDSPDSRKTRCVEWGGRRYPSLEDALDAANIILQLAPETNGEVGLRGVQPRRRSASACR